MSYFFTVFAGLKYLHFIFHHPNNCLLFLCTVFLLFYGLWPAKTIKSHAKQKQRVALDWPSWQRQRGKCVVSVLGACYVRLCDVIRSHDCDVTCNHGVTWRHGVTLRPRVMWPRNFTWYHGVTRPSSVMMTSCHVTVMLWCHVTSQPFVTVLHDTSWQSSHRVRLIKHTLC